MGSFSLSFTWSVNLETTQRGNGNHLLTRNISTYYVCSSGSMRSWIPNWMSHSWVATFQNLLLLGRDTGTLDNFTARKMPTSLGAKAATERKYRRKDMQWQAREKMLEWRSKLTFWSLGGDPSSLPSQTRHEDRTSPWLSGGLLSNLHAPDPPDGHIRTVMAACLDVEWQITYQYRNLNMKDLFLP